MFASSLHFCEGLPGCRVFLAGEQSLWIFRFAKNKLHVPDEWSPSPAQAFQVAVCLNDKYELDGRDPNGYAGIAWSIVGKFDRPWFDRSIFGLIRYMSGGSTGKKFDSRTCIQQNLLP